MYSLSYLQEHYKKSHRHSQRNSPYDTHMVNSLFLWLLKEINIKTHANSHIIEHCVIRYLCFQ
jgi:hypothetical protein